MFKDLLTGIAEGLVLLGENSYTQEEKDMIKKVRDIMKMHCKDEAVEALDKVIADMIYGVTKNY